MRISPTLIALVVCSATLVAAHGQQSAAVNPRTSGGLSLAYDAPHRQFSATGLQLRPSKVHSNTVTPTTGTVEVTLTINLVSRYGHDTSFPCSVIVIAGNIDLNSYTVEGGIETAYGIARTVPGTTTAVCKLSVPYAIDLTGSAAANSGLIVAYAAAAVNDRGDTQRSTLQISGIDNLPASDYVTKLSFDAAL